MIDAVVYTDGSCSFKNGTGGWAFIVMTDDETFEHSGSEADTSLGRMELMGPLMALEYLTLIEANGMVLIVSDSQYVVDGFNDKRRARNKHKDLWNRIEELVELIEGEVLFEHVKGHSGDFWNERADELAGAARLTLWGKTVTVSK
jgi:ribonuclease HI